MPKKAKVKPMSALRLPVARMPQKGDKVTLQLKKSAPPPPPPPPPKKPVGQGFKPVYVHDHGNTRAPHRNDPEGIPFQLELPARPVRATHLRWTNGKTTVEVPIGHYGDFSSMKSGHVEWGIVRQPTGEWIPVGEVEGRAEHIAVRDAGAPPPPRKPGPPPPPGSKVVATNKPTRQPKAAGTGPKKEGVCSFIDALIMEGGRTVEQVLAIVMAKFPGRDPQATTSTIKTRPSHIKAKGLTPPAFAK